MRSFIRNICRLNNIISAAIASQLAGIDGDAASILITLNLISFVLSLFSNRKDLTVEDMIESIPESILMRLHTDDISDITDKLNKR